MMTQEELDEVDRQRDQWAWSLTIRLAFLTAANITQVIFCEEDTADDDEEEARSRVKTKAPTESEDANVT